MIPPVNHIENWRYMRQQKQTQIEIYVIRENSTRIDHNYNIGDKLLFRINQAYKYETPFQGPYEIFHMWMNRAFTIRTGAVTATLNIRHTKPYNIP